MKHRIGIFLFNNVEVLDFSGPFEVFSTASRLSLREGKENPFEIFTFSNSQTVITARGGLKVLADHTLATTPQADVLIFPGGGIDEPLSEKEVIDFIKNRKNQVNIIASVCTGAFFLERANLLQGIKATTHWEALTRLGKSPNIKVISGVKFVDEGSIITSAGVSSGIAMSLHLVAKLKGQDLAHQTAALIEYPYEG